MMHTNSARLPYTAAEVDCMGLELQEKVLGRDLDRKQPEHALDATGKEHHDQDKDAERIKERTQGFYSWNYVRQHTIPEELNDK